MFSILDNQTNGLSLTWKILTVVVLILLFMKNIGPMLFDVYTDGELVSLYYFVMSSPHYEVRLAKFLPTLYGTDRWEPVVEETKTMKHWYGFSPEELFWLTLIPFLLPMMTNFFHSIDFIISNKIDEMVASKKMRVVIKILMLIIFPLWPVFILIMEMTQRFFKKNSKSFPERNQAAQHISILQAQ